MKTGMTLEQLAKELTRQRDAKRDYVADTRKLSVTKDAKSIELAGVGTLPIRSYAHRQIAEKLDIPTKFYDRMQSAHPDVLANTINALFEREPSQNMIRVMDGQVRAVVSNKFRALDNFDLANAVLPVLLEAGVHVESADITETRMYIKAVHPTLKRELAPPAGAVMGQGHTIFTRLVQAAITIRNSEVGHGSLAVETGALERACTNLATFNSSFKRSHVGRKHEVDEEIAEVLSDDTRRLQDAVVWSKLRDLTVAAFDGSTFERTVEQMLKARGDAITSPVAEVVEVLGIREGLNETERGSFLNYLIESGENTRYGLQWAATRLAQDVDSYERASELERLGGRIIQLAPTEWKEILKKAA